MVPFYVYILGKKMALFLFWPRRRKMKYFLEDLVNWLRYHNFCPSSKKLVIFMMKLKFVLDGSLLVAKQLYIHCCLFVCLCMSWNTFSICPVSHSQWCYWLSEWSVGQLYSLCKGVSDKAAHETTEQSTLQYMCTNSCPEEAH